MGIGLLWGGEVGEGQMWGCVAVKTWGKVAVVGR